MRKLSGSWAKSRKYNWQGFLKALDLEEERSDILFQFVISKGYEAALIWKIPIYCKQRDFGLSALEFTNKKEKN